MAEVAVAAGGAAAPAAALLRLLGLEHDKQRQPQAQRREQDAEQDFHIHHPPQYTTPAARAGLFFAVGEKDLHVFMRLCIIDADKTQKNPPPEGGGKNVRFYLGVASCTQVLG